MLKPYVDTYFKYTTFWKVFILLGLIPAAVFIVDTLTSNALSEAQAYYANGFEILYYGGASSLIKAFTDAEYPEFGSCHYSLPEKMKKTFSHIREVNTPGTGELFTGCEKRFKQSKQSDDVLDPQTFMQLATLSQDCEKRYGALYLCFRNNPDKPWHVLLTDPGELGLPWSAYDQRDVW